MKPLKLVWFDPFALADIGREHHLSGLERHVLSALTMYAAWRTQEFQGTITELHELTGETRKRITTAIDRLHQLGLVDILQPFVQHGEGVVAILCFCRLVNPANCEEKPHKPRSIALETRPNRDVNALDGAIELGKPGVSKATRKEGVTRVNRDRWEESDEDLSERTAERFGSDSEIYDEEDPDQPDPDVLLKAWEGRPFTPESERLPRP